MYYDLTRDHITKEGIELSRRAVRLQEESTVPTEKIGLALSDWLLREFEVTKDPETLKTCLELRRERMDSTKDEATKCEVTGRYAEVLLRKFEHTGRSDLHTLEDALDMSHFFFVWSMRRARIVNPGHVEHGNCPLSFHFRWRVCVFRVKQQGLAKCGHEEI